MKHWAGLTCSCINRVLIVEDDGTTNHAGIIGQQVGADALVAALAARSPGV